MPVIALPNGKSMVVRDAITVRGRYDLDPAYADMMHELLEAFPDTKALKEMDLSDPDTADALTRGTTGKFVRASREFEFASILAFVTEWNLGVEVSRNGILSIDDDEVYKAVVKEVYPLAMRAMGVDLSFTADAIKDPDSPTAPSSATDGGERAAAVPSIAQTSEPSA